MANCISLVTCHHLYSIKNSIFKYSLVYLTILTYIAHLLFQNLLISPLFVKASGFLQVDHADLYKPPFTPP